MMTNASTTTTTRRPIEPSWKISEVIGLYPELIDELAAINPAFRRLRNPIMRRVQSRLVTVAQAAEIAGMKPDALVQALNHAAGVVGSTPPDWRPPFAAGVSETPPWVGTTPVSLTVDVRPLQQEGLEPFSVIMAAARKVRVGEGFRLINTFEPVPLYDVLGRRGFVHWAEQRGPEYWEILFFHAGASQPGGDDPPSRPVETQNSDLLAWESPTATLTIDVSELVPPEPMIRILEALEALPAGATLLVHHVRRPIHLYPRLDELGYRHETREPSPGRVEILIRKATAPGGDPA